MVKKLPKKKYLKRVKKPEKLVSAWQKIHLAEGRQSGEGLKRLKDLQRLAIARMDKLLEKFSKDEDVLKVAALWRKAVAAPPLQRIIETKLVELFNAWEPTTREKLPQWFIDLTMGHKPIPTPLEDNFNSIIMQIKKS